MGRNRAVSLAVVLAVSAMGLTGVVSAAQAQGVLPCPDVIAMSNKLSRTTPEKSRDPEFIGRRLNIEAFFAEKCLLAYGRRVSKPVRLGDERRETLQDRWESGPHEEVAREEQGDVTRHVDNERRKLPREESKTGYEGFQFRKEDPDLDD